MGLSIEYLESWLEKAKEYLPEWLLEELHKKAFATAGAKARWREIDDVSFLEKMALSEMTPKKLRDISDDELRMAWLRLHQWYANAKKNNKPIENIVNAGVWVLDELKKRGVNYDEEDELVKEIEKLKGNNELLKSIDKLPDEIVVIPNFVNIVGSAVYDVDKADDIDILFRAKRDKDDNYLIEGQNIRLPLRKVFDPDKEGKIHYIDGPQGSHDDYIPLYSLVLRKEKPELQIVKEDKQEIKKFAPFENFIPPKPKMAGYTEAFDVKDLIDWANGQKIAIEPKYNGFRAIVQRKGDRVSLSWEGTLDKNRIDNFPEIKAGLPDKDFVFDGDIGLEKDGKRKPRIDVMKLNANKFELEEGEKVILTIYDVLYWDGKDLTNEPFEERRKVLESIKFDSPAIRISELRWATNTTEIKAYTKWAFKHDMSEGLVAKLAISKYSTDGSALDWFKLKKVVELKVIVLDVHKVKDGYNYDCGVLLGDADFTNTVEMDGNTYVNLGKSMNTKLKAKKGDILTVQILELIPDNEKKTLVWQNATVIDIDDTRKQPYFANQCIQVAEEGKVLQRQVKKCFYSEPKPSNLYFIIYEPSEFDIVREEPLVGPIGRVFKEHYLEPLGLTKDSLNIVYLNLDNDTEEEHRRILKELRDQNPFGIFVGLGYNLKKYKDKLDIILPFPLASKQYLDGISNELQRKLNQLKKIIKRDVEDEETRAERSEEFWSENWYKLYPPSGKGRFVLQHHWRGLSEEELGLDEKELLQTDHSVHGDLRFEGPEGLWGFTVFEGDTEELRKLPHGSRLIDFEEGKNIQGTFKLEQPKEWLTVGIKKPYISEPGGVGSTSNKYAKFFALDWGTYEIGVWREHMIEVFLNGNKLKGRMIIEYAPVDGKRIWLIDRPKDQTPYAEKRDKDEVIEELKQKGQKYLVWRNPNEDKPPELIKIDTVKKVEIFKVDADKQLVYGVVLEPESVDAQGDIVSADEIEQAAHKYLVKSRVLGERHSQRADAEVVESYIAPTDFKIGDQTIKKGSWIIVSHVLDSKLWQDIKDGKITGYSIGGFAEKE